MSTVTLIISQRFIALYLFKFFWIRATEEQKIITCTATSLYSITYSNHQLYIRRYACVNGCTCNNIYPLSMETSVSAFLAQSTAFLQPDMIVCGCTLDATNCSASYYMTMLISYCMQILHFYSFNYWN